MSPLIKSSIETKIGGVSVKPSKIETLLAVSISWELKFENHISDKCSKVSRKLSVLGRIAGYITLEKHRMLFKAFN